MLKLFFVTSGKELEGLQSAMDELDYLQLAEAINRGSGLRWLYCLDFIARTSEKVFQELSHDKQEDIVKDYQHASKVADLLNDMETIVLPSWRTSRRSGAASCSY